MYVIIAYYILTLKNTNMVVTIWCMFLTQEALTQI